MKWLLILFISVFSYLQAYSLVIKLIPEANVSGISTELGEIAEITAENEQEKLLLQNLVLFPIPQKVRILKADELKYLLKDKIRGQYLLLGDKTLIKPVFTRLMEEEILEKIKAGVLKNYPEMALDSIKILLLDKLGSIKVPYGKITIRTLVPGGIFYLPKNALIEISVDNQLYLSKSVRLKLSSVIEMAIAKKNLNENEKLCSTNILICKKVVENPDEYFTDFKNLDYFSARKKIKIGGQILKRDLIKKNIIKKGQRVLGIFKDKDSLFEIPMIAVIEGGLFDQIMLINPANGKKYQARILDNKKAEILN